jgi:hypothetical protein
MSKVRKFPDPANNKSLWSSADYERLVEMYRAGEPIGEIAKAMGRSQEAVRNKARQRGLSQPNNRPLSGRDGER